MFFMQKHVSDTCREHGSITNQFPDLKNPHLESKIIKIGLETPEIWFTNMDAFFLGHSVFKLGFRTNMDLVQNFHLLEKEI